MDSAHLHLISNHVPVLASLFGAAVLAVGLAFRRADVVRVALGLFVVGALGAAVTYATGEPAEHRVEGAAGVTDAAIEAHEEAAKAAFAGNLVLGAAALGAFGLSLRRPRPAANGGGSPVPFATRGVPRAVAVGVLVLALGVSAQTGYVANLGGQIRHPEIRPGSAPGTPASTGGPAREAAPTEHDEEHD